MFLSRVSSTSILFVNWDFLQGKWSFHHPPVFVLFVIYLSWPREIHSNHYAEQLAYEWTVYLCYQDPSTSFSTLSYSWMYSALNCGQSRPFDKHPLCLYTKSRFFFSFLTSSLKVVCSLNQTLMEAHIPPGVKTPSDSTGPPADVYQSLAGSQAPS